jgi:hypothetical protein
MRADCKMNQLSPSRRDAIFALAEKTPTEKLAQIIREKDGIKISATAVGNWLRAETIVRRAQNNMDVARRIVEAYKANGEAGTVEEAIESLAKERALDVLAESSDHEEVAALVRLVNELRKTKLSERRVAVIERRAGMGDEPKKTKSPKDIKAEIDRILGL